MLPLLTELPPNSLTHLIIAAIHLNDNPGDITLNDDPFASERSSRIWAEAQQLQAAGVRVLGMLGGAAKGTFARLDAGEGDDASEKRFRSFYEPLRDAIMLAGLDGLDLDVEEDMSLTGIIGLIDALRSDFGPDFIITMAPVAAALEFRDDDIPNVKTNLSGFDYFDFDEVFGDNVAWYNTQFYCGWGNATNTAQYERIIAKGWDPSRIVMGLSTNPGSAAGWVPDDVARGTVGGLVARYGRRFGGVMGWEYWNSVTSLMPFGVHSSWAQLMASILRQAR